MIADDFHSDSLQGDNQCHDNFTEKNFTVNKTLFQVLWNTIGIAFSTK